MVIISLEGNQNSVWSSCNYVGDPLGKVKEYLTGLWNKQRGWEQTQ